MRILRWFVTDQAWRKVAEAPLGSSRSATQAQSCDQGSVPLHVLFLEIPKQTPTLPNHHQQTPPTVMILLVDLQVLGQVVDALRQQCNLNLGGTRVRGMRAVFIYNILSVAHEVLSYVGK